MTDSVVALLSCSPMSQGNGRHPRDGEVTSRSVMGAAASARVTRRGKPDHKAIGLLMSPSVHRPLSSEQPAPASSPPTAAGHGCRQHERHDSAKTIAIKNRAVEAGPDLDKPARLLIAGQINADQ